MASRSVKLEDFGARLIGDTRRESAAIRRGMREAAFVSEIIVSVKTPVDEGATRAAWRTVITEDGAEVVNDSPVVLFLENGTRPHRPPLLPIVRWLARKTGAGSAIQSIDDAPPEIRARAIAIADKIEERGTPAIRMVDSSYDDMQTHARRRVERALAKEHRRK